MEMLSSSTFHSVASTQLCTISNEALPKSIIYFSSLLLVPPETTI